MKRLFVLAIIGVFLLVGCSSTNQYEYYKLFAEENNAPQINLNTGLSDQILTSTST